MQRLSFSAFNPPFSLLRCLNSHAGSARPTPLPRLRSALDTASLERNLLHAAELQLLRPRTGEPLKLEAPLSPELLLFVDAVEGLG